MVIAERLRKLREAKALTQGDIEQRTGLLRCYISRVENGATVPSLQTLQKLAEAYEMPLWKVFFEGQEEAKPLRLSGDPYQQEEESPTIELLLAKLIGPLARITERDRNLLLYLAARMARKRNRPRCRKDRH